MDVLTTLVPLLIMCGIFATIAIPIVKGLNRKIEEKDLGPAVAYIAVCLLLSRMFGIVMIIYTIIKWEKTRPVKTTLEPPEDPDPEPVPVKKVQVEDGYEKWKAERMKGTKNDN